LGSDVTRLGEPKAVSLTTQEFSSASRAEEALGVGRFDPRGAQSVPTHRVEVDLRGVQLRYAGNSATGLGGIELQTLEAVRALSITRLGP
jgi:hypothetical protein